jgi:beta-glucosidase
VFEDPANVSLARATATKAIVLLTNDGVLPLSRSIRKLAVIGPAADDRRLLQGDYHYPAHQEVLLDPVGAFAGGEPLGDPTAREGGSPIGHSSAAEPGAAVRPVLEGEPESAAGFSGLMQLPSGNGAFKPGPYYTNHVTPLRGLRDALGPASAIVHERGCDLTGDDRSGFPAAVAAAAAADVAILFLGGRSGLDREATVGEARDATDLRLTGLQEELAVAVAATGTPTVVVVMSGRAHVLTGVVDAASALVAAWPLGEQGGNALADVLTGRAEPGGRLPLSLPRATGQIPIYHSQRSGGARPMFYGDYTDCEHTPLFCFGHGLGYTTFEQSELAVSATDTVSPISVEVTVTNTGARAGEEVVQLYASDLVASVARPELSLIGFARVALAPRQRRRVRFEVHPSRLAFYDEAMRFVVEPGQFRFSVGASAGDLRQQCVIELAGGVAEYSQRRVVAVRASVGEATAVEAQAPRSS